MFEGLPHVFEKGNSLTDSSVSATEGAKYHRKMTRFFWRSRQVCGTIFLPLQKFHYGLGAKIVVDWRPNENQFVRENIDVKVGFNLYQL
jgi:hypothetical protein